MVIFSFSYSLTILYTFSTLRMRWETSLNWSAFVGGGLFLTPWKVLIECLNGRVFTCPCLYLISCNPHPHPPPRLNKNLFGSSPTLKPVRGSPPFFTWQLMWSVLRILTRTANPLTSLMAICVISWVKLKSVREHSVITVATWLPI